jgi:hypothetical protein
MKFTFGIPTAGNVDLSELISNITDMNIPEYEILVIGGNLVDDIFHNGIKVGKHIPFDEYSKQGWITRKKNILAQEAKYENLVLLHDYYRFEPGWYEGWIKFGNEFHVAVNIIQNIDGSRFADWLLNPELYDRTFGFKSHRWLIPYNMSCPKIQYISGGYFVVKKEFLLQHPLDETRVWNECEDTEWCERIAEHTTMKMNTFSIAKVTKPKWRMYDADINDVKNFASTLNVEIEYTTLD